MRGPVVALAALALAAFAAGCGGRSSAGEASSNSPTASVTTTSKAPTSTVQTLAVTPHSGLTSSQTVHYTAKGFRSGDNLAVAECVNHGHKTTSADCDVLGTTTASGAGIATGTAKVSAGPIGTVHGRCGHPIACLLSVSEFSATGLSATQILSFGH